MKIEDNASGVIREIRLALGLTQAQFATKLGVTFPTVNRWENKKAKPSPLAIQKLNNLLTSLQRKQKNSKEGSVSKPVGTLKTSYLGNTL